MSGTHLLLCLTGAELGLGFPVTLKLELLQHAGSFKPRGAFNRLLSAELPAAGAIAASGGNHGAAVAYAARSLGVTAEIFVPALTPPAKVARIASYGAQVVQTGATYAGALAASRSAVASTIGLLELSAQARQLVDYTAQSYESFIAVTLAYMLINLIVMQLMRWVEAKTRLPGYIGGK